MLAQKGNIYQRQVRDPLYGQLVIGPPGSGKTTYCHKINEFYKELERNVAVVNLDPANEQMEYNAQIDIVSSFIKCAKMHIKFYLQRLFSDEIDNGR